MDRSVWKLMEEVKAVKCEHNKSYCNQNCGTECCLLAQAILNAAKAIEDSIIPIPVVSPVVPPVVITTSDASTIKVEVDNTICPNYKKKKVVKKGR